MPHTITHMTRPLHVLLWGILGIGGASQRCAMCVAESGRRGGEQAGSFAMFPLSQHARLPAKLMHIAHAYSS